MGDGRVLLRVVAQVRGIFLEDPQGFRLAPLRRGRRVDVLGINSWYRLGTTE